MTTETHNIRLEIGTPSPSLVQRNGPLILWLTIAYSAASHIKRIPFQYANLASLTVSTFHVFSPVTVGLGGVISSFGTN